MELSVAPPTSFAHELLQVSSIIDEEATQKLTEPAILMRLVDHISAHPGASLSFEEIPITYHLSKRALNDFLVVTSALGVTKRHAPGIFSFEGKGLDRRIQMQLSQEVEMAAKRGSMAEIFGFNDVPPIDELALRFVKLFLFLRKDSIDIRQAAKLMSTKNAKYKTVLRKLYLVTTSLEASGIVEKTRNLSEVKFVNTDWTTSEADRMNVLSMLVDHEKREDEIYERRRRTFEEQTFI